MSSAAVVIGALRVNMFIVANRDVSHKSKTELYTVLILMRWLVTSRVIWIYTVYKGAFRFKVLKGLTLFWHSKCVNRHVSRVERKTIVTQTVLKPLFRGNFDPFVNNANLGAIAHTSNGT